MKTLLTILLLCTFSQSGFADDAFNEAQLQHDWEDFEGEEVDFLNSWEEVLEFENGDESGDWDDIEEWEEIDELEGFDFPPYDEPDHEYIYPGMFDDSEPVDDDSFEEEDDLAEFDETSEFEGDPFSDY